MKLKRLLVIILLLIFFPLFFSCSEDEEKINERVYKFQNWYFVYVEGTPYEILSRKYA